MKKKTGQDIEDNEMEDLEDLEETEEEKSTSSKFLDNKFTGMHLTLVNYLKKIDDAVFQKKLKNSTQSAKEFEKGVTQ